MQQSAKNMQWLETLKDRSHVLIRPAGTADVIPGADLSGEGPAVRFIGQIPGIPRSFSPSVHPARGAAFVAIAYDGPQERIVGVGEFKTFERGLRCRCEVTVDARWREKGLDCVLMRHLIALARSRGLRLVYAHCGSNDGPTNALAQQLGFRTTLDAADPAWLVHEIELS